MTDPIQLLGADRPSPASASPSSTAVTSAERSAASEFEASVFNDTDAAGEAAAATMTVGDIVRSFGMASLFREAFNTDDWGK